MNQDEAREALLTAYALGELGPKQKAEIEAELAGNEAERVAVEEIQGLGEVLSRELRAEGAPGLGTQGRNRIEQHLALSRPATPASWFGRRMLVGLAAGGLAVAAAGLMIPVMSGSPRERFSGSESTVNQSLDTTGSVPHAAEPRPSLGRDLDAVHTAPVAPRPVAAAMPPADPRAPAEPRPKTDEEQNTESYDAVKETGFRFARNEPLSTFSIDVDTASYANVRRFLDHSTMPSPGAIRIEEMVNYFTYDYAGPQDEHPFAVHLEVAGCPWATDHRLVRIGLKGRELDLARRPATNLVFLIDVSGSMNQPNKLPLLKDSFRLLVEELGENDSVAMVVYAGASGLVLPPTPGDQKGRILAAFDQLQAGGSTNGGAGIELAYQTAVGAFIEGGVNRVLLATDGDFNVGVASRDQLVGLVQQKAKSGVFLSILGFGMGNYKDGQLEEIADKGNGNYSYIDTIREGKKVLVEQMSGTLVTIAKDVKIQVEFNPARVQAYRLIGYENRILAHEDFNDDKKDAGEIGAGHTVTALYEVIPAGADAKAPGVDPLKYQTPRDPAPAGYSDEVLTLKLRYKAPDGDTSRLIEQPVTDAGKSFDQASDDFQFAAAVAEFGMLLRGSEYKGHANYDAVLELAGSGVGKDPGGYRTEFLGLVRKAKALGR